MQLITKICEEKKENLSLSYWISEESSIEEKDDNFPFVVALNVEEKYYMVLIGPFHLLGAVLRCTFFLCVIVLIFHRQNLPLVYLGVCQ